MKNLLKNDAHKTYMHRKKITKNHVQERNVFQMQWLIPRMNKIPRINKRHRTAVQHYYNYCDCTHPTRFCNLSYSYKKRWALHYNDNSGYWLNWKNVLNIIITGLHSHFSIMSTWLYKPSVTKGEKEGKGQWK